MSRKSTSSDDIEHIERYDDVPGEQRYTSPSPIPVPRSVHIEEEPSSARKPSQGLPMPSAPPPQTSSSKPSGGQESFDFNLDQGGAVIDTRLNIDDRDEEKLNQGLKTHFLEVFAEPGPEQHSIACVWTNSYRTFEITRIYVYKFLTLILALPIAFIMGFIFALVAFLQIWIIKPLLRVCRLLLHQALFIWPMFLVYLVRPCFYSMGAIFSTFRLHQTNGAVIQEPWEPIERP